LLPPFEGFLGDLLPLLMAFFFAAGAGDLGDLLLLLVAAGDRNLPGDLLLFLVAAGDRKFPGDLLLLLLLLVAADDRKLPGDLLPLLLVLVAVLSLLSLELLLFGPSSKLEDVPDTVIAVGGPYFLVFFAGAVSTGAGFIFCCTVLSLSSILSRLSSICSRRSAMSARASFKHRLSSLSGAFLSTSVR